MPGDEVVARPSIADVFARLDRENASNDTKILEQTSIGRPTADMH